MKVLRAEINKLPPDERELALTLVTTTVDIGEGSGMTSSQKLQLGLAFAFGVVFLSLILAIAIFIPSPTDFQYQVFRITLALAAGGIAAVIPGILNVNIPHVLTAGGALAVFVVVYFYSPAQLIASHPESQESKHTVAPKPPDELGLSIEEFNARVDSSASPFAEQQHYIEGAVGKAVDWEVSVSSIRQDRGRMLLLFTPPINGEAGRAIFESKDESRLMTLGPGDVIRIKGIVENDQGIIIAATGFEVIRRASPSTSHSP